MAWHSNVSDRWKEGEEREAEFDHLFLCTCGGQFVPNNRVDHFAIDRKCKKCGKLVDIKSCKDAMAYSSITISQPAFDHYPPDAKIIAKFGDEWWGARKDRLNTEGPFPSIHKGPYSTPFYKIRRDQFFPVTNYVKRK